MLRKLLLVVSIATIIGVIPGMGMTAEFRGLWIDGWHSGMWTAGEIDTMLSIAKNANYNVIVPQIRKKADALYNSTYGGPNGTGEPKPDQVQPPSFDPLAYMCQQAHALGIEVHPWVCTHRCPTQTYDWFYTTYNHWLTRDQAGNLINSEGYYLDPGVPDGEEYTVNIALDIATRYDIDGIQWDRIRYPAANSGYNSIAIARFQQEYGYVPTYTDNTFKNWRRKQLNGFVARVYAQLMEVRPDICVGANTWITYATGNGTYYQDADAWMANKWLDINVPMNYTATNSSFTSNLVDWLGRAYGRYVYSGMNVGASGQTQANACTQINYTRSYNPAYGVPKGCQTYSYYHGTVTSPGWFDYVHANSSRPYYTADTIPAIPWKSNPTMGMVMGQVTKAGQNDPYTHDWVYNATVTLYHPGPPEVIMETTTDQTGYYVFSEVEPRQNYTITVSKSPITRTYYNQDVVAGKVLREDFGLVPTTCSSPSGTIRAGWNVISLPLEPSNPDPAVIFNGIDIEGKLFRWDNATGSFVVYDPWSPGDFGECSVKDGYYLFSTGTATISYQAYPKAPAMHDIPINNAGWAIIGCPYLSDKRWADVDVTKNGETVSMYTATRERGWMDSIGWWWDNTSQSLQTLGLPDDFPASEYLQPWYGYWVQTYSNNITLTLK